MLWTFLSEVPLYYKIWSFYLALGPLVVFVGTNIVFPRFLNSSSLIVTFILRILVQKDDVSVDLLASFYVAEPPGLRFLAHCFKRSLYGGPFWGFIVSLCKRHLLMPPRDWREWTFASVKFKESFSITLNRFHHLFAAHL